ncbi:MAG: hypothetical protein QGH60_04635 [Phycisphaerae bacterium]|jgi:hypothetical protein|nr:hypothetical protein [Phycisphaerae bacterium]
MGIGMTASGIGPAASSSAGDMRRSAQLAGQTTAFKKLVWEFIEIEPKARAKLTLGGRINPSGNYVTCFLYDDAYLFYAATWQALPTRKQRPATRLQPDQPTTKPKPTDSP